MDERRRRGGGGGDRRTDRRTDGKRERRERRDEKGTVQCRAPKASQPLGGKLRRDEGQQQKVGSGWEADRRAGRQAGRWRREEGQARSHWCSQAQGTAAWPMVGVGERPPGKGTARRRAPIPKALGLTQAGHFCWGRSAPRSTGTCWPTTTAARCCPLLLLLPLVVPGKPSYCREEGRRHLSSTTHAHHPPTTTTTITDCPPPPSTQGNSRPVTNPIFLDHHQGASAAAAVACNTHSDRQARLPSPSKARGPDSGGPQLWEGLNQPARSASGQNSVCHYHGCRPNRCPTGRRGPR